jgi:hypothetical protein
VKLVAPMLMHLLSLTRSGSTTTTGNPASSNALSDGLDASAVIKIAPACSDLSSACGLSTEARNHDLNGAALLAGPDWIPPDRSVIRVSEVFMHPPAGFQGNVGTVVEDLRHRGNRL